MRIVLPPAFEEMLQKIGLAPGPRPPRLKPRLPLAAVQVSAGRVSAVRLASPASRKGGAAARAVLAAHREIPLPPGAEIPTLTRPHVGEFRPVEEAVGRLLAEVAPRETRISLVLPDSAARVSLLKFGKMPATRREVMDLIRFRMQKVLPFRMEEAALDFQLLGNGGSEEPEFLVALIQRPVLFRYERLFSSRDLVPGLVDLESFNLANLLSRSGGIGGGEGGDRALINAAEGYLTVLFFREGRLNFYRSKQLSEEERILPERLHAAIRREAASCAAFYREHLSGAGMAGAAARIVEGDPGQVLEIVREEMGCPVQVLDPSRAVELPPGAGASDGIWQRLAPALGAALGRRV
jgi:type IV pilus assembly protein PilM